MQLTVPTLVEEDYWYHHRRYLEPGMVFITNDGAVKLDRNVPGDATKWYVADWCNGWAFYDSTIEPGELLTMPIADTPEAVDHALKHRQ
ncbi:hypothetical protein [Acidovorax sp. sic0104]|uniref:hypothetical protein n=1 Tax=Acidovorax sp. sic0104 TaxID=2854784 RepID=UPI001C44E1E7|nr:hypothetical protein [Acidovorax sp. sic0104]MBV7542030.1 hypothetical protein [Acidovorax sp. sic0104]